MRDSLIKNAPQVLIAVDSLLDYDIHQLRLQILDLSGPQVPIGLLSRYLGRQLVTKRSVYYYLLLYEGIKRELCAKCPLFHVVNQCFKVLAIGHCTLWAELAIRSDLHGQLSRFGSDLNPADPTLVPQVID